MEPRWSVFHDNINQDLTVLMPYDFGAIGLKRALDGFLSAGLEILISSV